MTNSMTPGALSRLIRTQIPLSKAMGIRVKKVSLTHGVHFALPLKPNRNHKNTAFGGTLVAAQALAAWAWLMSLLKKHNVEAEIVVQRLQSEFLKPVDQDFTVMTLSPTVKELQLFLKMLKRKNKARIAIKTQVSARGQVAVEYVGEYVAISSLKNRNHVRGRNGKLK